MARSPGAVRVEFLADQPALVDAVGQMRWQEWGAEPGREDAAWWTIGTRNEAGRDNVPVTWVAIGKHGEALGAVGLAEHDIEERREHSPWIVGMIVREDLRGRGIGGRLVAALEEWARAQGYVRLSVATGGRAVAFYEKCGWHVRETLVRGGGVTTVLGQRL